MSVHTEFNSATKTQMIKTTKGKENNCLWCYAINTNSINSMCKKDYHQRFLFFPVCLVPIWYTSTVSTVYSLNLYIVDNLF